LVEPKLIEKLVLRRVLVQCWLLALDVEALEVLEVLRWAVVRGYPRLEALVLCKILLPRFHGELLLTTELADVNVTSAFHEIWLGLHRGRELRFRELHRGSSSVEVRLGASLLPAWKRFWRLEGIRLLRPYRLRSFSRALANQVGLKVVNHRR